MPETNTEANTEVKDFDSMADKILDDHEASSASKTGNEGEEQTETGVDQSKKAIPESSEQELSSEEQALKRVEEAIGDDPIAMVAYIKKMGYHKDPAWQKLLAKTRQVSTVDDETKKQLEEFKQVTSSPEYVRLSMKRQGYTDEAINSKLKELGHTVEDKQLDDIGLVVSKLGIDPNSMDANQKATVTDIAKIARIMAEDIIGKALPNTLKPMQETLQTVEQANNASRLIGSMRETVSAEGVLDFAKDVEPELHKFIDDTPDCTQQDIQKHFVELNHKLTVERLKMGKKQVERTDRKNSNRPLSSTGQQGQFRLSKRTGDFNKDANAVLDAFGVPE
jgi:hypothetical protein